MKKLIPILCLLLASCSERMAEVYISPELPQQAKTDFLGRIETSTLRNAIDHAGQFVKVAPGMHFVRVPCDGVSEGNFAKVQFKLEPENVNRVTFKSCGVSIKTTSR